MSLKPKEVDFSSTWNMFRETVRGVITLSDVRRAVWNERFTDVYNMCVAYPDPLSDRLYQNTKEFLDLHVKEIYKMVRSHGEENLLSAYHDSWSIYSRAIEYLNKLYTYLNTECKVKNKMSEADSNSQESQEKMLEIGELGLDLWKKNMIESLQESLVALLLDEINNDRCGESPNQAVLHGVIQSFVSVEKYKKTNATEFYENTFEKHLLSATGDYYKKAASNLLQESDCSLYMEKVIQKQEDENLRCRKFLHPSSYEKVIKEFQERMVADHLEFLHSECKSMVRQEKRKDLQNMYSLLKSVSNGLPILIQKVQSHLKRKGMEAVTNLKGDNLPAQFVENLLEIHRTSHELIRDVFHSDPLFVGALDKACVAVVNHRPGQKQPCRSPELLAKYCDALLKKSAKGTSESETDDKLASSITVFKYLDDKDVFQKFYANMLAKRLIYGQSLSMDIEEGMIPRLKQACGWEYTDKLRTMFTDMTVSSDLNNTFTTHLRNSESELAINFSIRVLQALAWPLNQSILTQFTIPKELEKSVQLFEIFYGSRHNNRKLTWLHHLSTAELRLCYLKKTYFVTMGTYQMAILLLFESSNSLTYREIQESTSLHTEQLDRSLQSLIESKVLISSQATLSETADIKLNLDFTNKRTKFKITNCVQKEQQREVEQTRVTVDGDRKIYIQAAIVRIMKSRKLLKHNALIEEVINQSKAMFAPSIAMIKKCIEVLIDKDYIERPEKSVDEYSYIA